MLEAADLAARALAAEGNGDDDRGTPVACDPTGSPTTCRA
jgi:hypothetical protein